MKKNIIQLIGILLFAVILWKTDLRQLWSLLLDARLGLVFLALILYFPVLLIQAFKWKYIMKQQRIQYSLKDSVLMYASGIYLGLVTPGRLGDLAKTFYLKPRYSLGKSFMSVFLDRLTDTLFILLVAYIGLWHYLYAFQTLFFILTGVLVIIGIASLLLFWKKDFIEKMLVWILTHLVPSKYHPATAKNTYDFLHGFASLRAHNYGTILLLTVVMRMVYFYMVFLMSQALSLDVSYFFIVFMVGISSFLSLLPITVLGIGTRDAAFIALFGLYGLSSESAVALSTLTLAILLFAAIMGMLAWIKKPINLKKSKTIEA